MNKHLEVLVGPPGCGKSTYSKTRPELTYINQDSQGKVGHLDAFNRALAVGKPIILDRMNFNKEQRLRYIQPAKAAGYSVDIKVFRVPRKLCLDRIAKRKDHETIKDARAADSAVNLFFGKYEEPSLDEGSISFCDFNAGSYKPEVIISDLDGTTCLLDHRRHYVEKSKPDDPFKKKPNWPAFFRAMKDDAVNEPVARVLRQFHKAGYPIVYCSGRPEEYREATIEWLVINNLWFGDKQSLFMRSKGDYRQDDIVKEILLDFDILPQFAPLFVMDDRQQVVDMWRKRGITCFQVASGDF